MSVNKQADSGMPDISAHRQLAPHEEEALAAGKSRWLPRIFQSYGTPIPELMASPLKTGLIYGAPIGILGAGLGSAIGGKHHSGLGALIGGLGAGGLAALAAGMDRAAKNEGLEELMRRMPEGAAKRDLEADPQYQSDFLGWDNNKIVATARARYYRPTERFSKRTFDMADARARYNERHKSSSIYKDVSMSQSEKQALSLGSQILLNHLLRTGALGAGVGAAAGAITSKNKLRGLTRGMLMGAGTGLGVGAGMPLGAAAGGGAYMGITGGPKSFQGMNNLANSMGVGTIAGGSLGGIGGHAGGKALADALVPMDKEDEEESKKAAQEILNNTTLTLAEKMAAYKNWLIKQADPVTMGATLPQGPGLAMEAPAGFDPSKMQMPISPTTGRPMNDPDAPAPAAPAKNPGFFASLREGLSSPTAFTSSGASDVEKLEGKGMLDFLSYLKRKGGEATEAGRSLVKRFTPAPKPPAEPTMMDKLNPYLDKVKPYAPHLAVGAGSLGALALAHYLSKRKKKKYHEDREDSEYDVAKAAHARNWYTLTNHAIKNEKMAVLGPAVTALAHAGKLFPAAARAAAPSLMSRLTPYAAPAAGTTAGVAGLYGLSKYLGGGKDPSLLQQIMNYKYTPHIAAGVGTAGLLGGAAYMGNRAGKNDAKKKKKPEGEKKADLASAGMGGAMGAGLGGLAGGLYGALAPGYEQDPDSGRRRRRSRLMAALRGLAGGAALGGAGGAALGHFMPGVPHGAMDAVGMGKELELPIPTAAENMQTNVAKMNPAQRKLHEVIMQRNKIKAPPTPDPIELAKAQANMQAMGEEPGSDPMLGPNAAMQNQMAQQ